MAALSSMVTPSRAIGILEGAADTGAGQHLVSYEALREQGYHDSSLLCCTNDSQRRQSLPFGLMPHDAPWFVQSDLMLSRMLWDLFGSLDLCRTLCGTHRPVRSNAKKITSFMLQELAAEPADPSGILSDPAVEPGVDVGDRSSVPAEVREVAPDVPCPNCPNQL